jgi:putative spermidine/putrescine transport system substrate-binding protein
MKRLSMALGALALLLAPMPATAQDKLVVSVWGGSWRDMVANIIGKKFTAETGVQVEYITGGTIDRLNKEKLAKGNPESDITFTTSHVGWLYANDGLYEQLDLAKVPNARNLVEQAKISPYHIGTWAYVYTIGYRPDLLKGVAFESWADLWKPEIKGKLAAPDFDPSHLIVVAARLSGGDAATWEKGQAKLKALKPNFKAFYTNDANSQQLIANGETPVQVILSMNAHYMAGEGVPIQLVIPKEGAVLGVQEGGARLQIHQHRFGPASAGRSRQVQEGQPGGPRRESRPGDRQAARSVHHRRPVEPTGDRHRPQATRGEDRGVAQMVHREHHQLTA